MKHIHTEKHYLPPRVSDFGGFLVVFFTAVHFGFFNCKTGVCCGLDRVMPFPFLSDLSTSGPWLPVLWGWMKEKCSSWAVLQSCQPGVAAWVSSPLRLCIALWWCSSGASLPGKASQEVLEGQGSLWRHGGLCTVGFIHWHNTSFDGAVVIQVWCWMGHSSWCQGWAVECWLSTLRAIPLSSPAVPGKWRLHTLSGAFWKPQEWSSPLGRQFLSFCCGAGVNGVEEGSSLVKCPQHQSVTNISSPFPGAFGGFWHPSNKAVSRWPQHMVHVSE